MYRDFGISSNGTTEEIIQAYFAMDLIALKLCGDADMGRSLFRGSLIQPDQNYRFIYDDYISCFPLEDAGGCVSGENPTVARLQKNATIEIIVHEFGHILDFTGVILNLDMLLYPGVGTEDPVSEYGQTNNKEDFAEALALYVTGDYLFEFGIASDFASSLNNPDLDDETRDILLERIEEMRNTFYSQFSIQSLSPNRYAFFEETFKNFTQTAPPRTCEDWADLHGIELGPNLCERLENYNSLGDYIDPREYIDAISCLG